MKKYSLYILLTLLTTLAGCSKMTHDQDRNDRSEPDASDVPVWALTVEAAKVVPGQAGDDSWGAAGEGTKALDLVNEGARLNVYWKNTETVKVYKAGTLLGSLTVTPDTGEKPASATLSGEITTEGLAVNDELTLLLPRESWDYSGQKGKLAKTADNETGTIEDSYDYALATVTVKAINGNSVTTTGASFENQQSIYRLDFKVNGSLRGVNWFSVSSNRNKLVTSRSYSGGWTSAYGELSVSLASAAKSPYLSLRNENTTTADTYTFFVRDGNNNLFTGTMEIETQYLGNGKFLAPGVDLSAYSIATTASGNISNTQDIF